MTKRYKTLQKKLQELEAKLSLVLSVVPAETTSTIPQHYLNLNAERIQQRLGFLKNLLSAEIACRPSKPRHLHHIGKRITELEIAFRCYETSSAGDNDFNYNVLNTPSTSVCSCDESSLEDDGEAQATAQASSGFTSPELGSSEDELLVQQINNSPRALVKVRVRKNGEEFSSSDDKEVEVGSQKNSPREKKRNVELGSSSSYSSSSSEQEVDQQNRSPTPVKSEVVNEVPVEEEKKEGRISALGKYCGALICGTIFGMILMCAAINMVVDCDSSYSPDESYHFYT